MKSLSLYIHIPFCQHRCGYCDFNTYAGMGHWIPKYVTALEREISAFNADSYHSEYRVDTIYFGGGTPSLLSPAQIGSVLGRINQVFRVDDDCEITMEANPGTVNLASFQGYLEAGINRLSLGVQSTNLSELQFLEREHGFGDVQQAVRDAKEAGIRNISLDLIYGLPHQNMDLWQNSLKDVIALHPAHLSLYALTIEDGTPFARYVHDGKMQYPDPDLAADMYDFAREFLADRGFVQYEISNWAGVGDDGTLLLSRHNRQYWLNGAYVGFGAGAHGSFGGERLENERSIVRYVRALGGDSQVNLPGTPATIRRTLIDLEREMNETMMMGLRLLIEGVSEDRFRERFGTSMRKEFGKIISRLEAKKLVKWVGDKGDILVLTEAAYLLGNQVFVEFI